MQCSFKSHCVQVVSDVRSEGHRKSEGRMREVYKGVVVGVSKVS